MERKKAIFFVDTPFQLLCAINAIRDFNFINYRLIIVDDNPMRLTQIINLCNAYNLKFEFFSLSSVLKCRYYSLLKHIVFSGTHDYDYVFVGDFREYNLGLYATGYLRKKGEFYFLDDGNVSISLFEGKFLFSRIELLKTWLLKILVNKVFYKHLKYYSVFSDIRSKLIVVPNRLNYIYNNKMGHSVSGVYFIGTTSVDYCKYLGIEISKYKENLKRCLIDLVSQYPDQDYYYIPHARDAMMEETKQLCKQYGFMFLPISECIEYYLINNDSMPLVCSGFGSTALYTIKILSPSTICIHNEIYGTSETGNFEYKGICEFYKRHGIVINNMLST